MAENSKIEWTDHTFNPWVGCTKVHAGCAHCYAETLMDHRYGKVQWGPNGTRVRTSEANWRTPLQWDRAARKAWRPALVFCASLADVFEDWSGPIHQVIDGAPDQLMKCPCGYRGFRSVIVRQLSPQKTTDDCPRCGVRLEPQTMADVRRDLFAVIDATPNLIWLMLTKRPENVRRMWPEKNWSSQAAADSINESGYLHRPNVRLGTSPCDQPTADKSIPELIELRDLCGGTFLSCEPLLGEISFSRIWNHGNFDPDFDVGIDWVIAGGESGPGARPMHPDWVRGLRDQCETAQVPFFFKQWGEWAPDSHVDVSGKPRTWYDENTDYVANDGTLLVDDPRLSVEIVRRVGKSAAGRLLDGREWSQFPAAFKREVFHA